MGYQEIHLLKKSYVVCMYFFFLLQKPLLQLIRGKVTSVDSLQIASLALV